MTSAFLSLPNEMMFSVLQHISASDAAALERTCRRMRVLLSNRTSFGKSVWKCIRQAALLPDGSPLGIDDFTIVSRFLKRWCGICHKRGMLLHDFITIRLCSNCSRSQTISVADLPRYVSSRVRKLLPRADVEGDVRVFAEDRPLGSYKGLEDEDVKEIRRAMISFHERCRILSRVRLATQLADSRSIERRMCTLHNGGLAAENHTHMSHSTNCPR